jgi:hypothetical protein
MRITNSGGLWVGTTTNVVDGIGSLTLAGSGGGSVSGGGRLTLFRPATDGVISGSNLGAIQFFGADTTENTPTQFAYIRATASGTHAAGDNPTDLTFATTAASSSTVTERMRIDSDGNLLVGKTATSGTTVGVQIQPDGIPLATVGSGAAYGLYVNRQADDGTLVSFRQANTQEGSISVSGTTVSYNGGHLSRWAQTTTAKDESLVKGTVLSNLDEMNVYTDADGNPVQNEQLNKVKVSDVDGDANVAGVFVNWDHDEDHNVDEINMAMTGDMIIRIAQGTTVARGDLLMSAGDGTAKPQGDDIVRSKTIAKVTSTHVTCTYDDGSYCVPCVLMAC